MRWLWIVLALTALTGCGGGVAQGDRGEAKRPQNNPVVTVNVEGLGPTMALARSSARGPSVCSVRERTTNVSVTFASRDPKRACETWIQRQSGAGESWVTNHPTPSGRKPTCIYLVVRFGLAEIDAGEDDAPATRLCAALSAQPRWLRFNAAEVAMKNGRPIPLLLDTPSASMEPTLHCARPGGGCGASLSDFLVIELSQAADLRRGDIAVFTAPQPAVACGAPGSVWSSRVIGLPGEKWKMRDGFVYINRKRLPEAYLDASRRSSDTLPERSIPLEAYVVLGDNRVASCDSRRWGWLPAENLIGRVVDVLGPK